MRPRLLDVRRIGIKALDDEGVVGPQRRGQLPIAAAELNDQPALDAGSLQDVLRRRLAPLDAAVGHAMTFKILTDKTQKIIYRSEIRSALAPGEQNYRMDPLGGEDLPPPPKIVKSQRDRSPPDAPMPPSTPGEEADSTTGDGGTEANSIPIFHPSDLVGRTFLMDKQEDGQRFRVSSNAPEWIRGLNQGQETVSRGAPGGSVQR